MVERGLGSSFVVHEPWRSATRLPLPVVLVLIGIPIFVARHSTPSLAWDDGPVFQVGASNGLASILEPYGGYFHPLARSIALLASVAGTWTVAWAASLAIALFVAAYVASDHITPVLPKRWQRILAGLAVLVLPGTVQTLGLLGQVQWYAMIYLLAWLVSGSANRIALGAFALSGPYAVLFAPLVLLRRPAGWPVVLACGVVQAIGFLTSPRGASLELDRFAEVLAFRAVPGVFLGEVNASGIPVLFVITAAVLVAAAVISDQRLWPVFAGGATVAVLGLLFAGETNVQLLAGSGSRYFLAMTFGLVLFVLRSPRSPLAWAIATLVVVGTVDDLRVPARDYYGWP